MDAAKTPDIRHVLLTLTPTLMVLGSLPLAGCNRPAETNPAASGFGPAPAHSTQTQTPQTAAAVDTSLFGRDALVKPAEWVECTLSNGQASTCAKLTLKYKPDNLKIGPFCPSSLDDTGGIWNWDGERAGLYRINGEFLKMLDGLGYRFYDDAGKVFTATDLSVPPKAKHACLNVGPQQNVQMTVLLPRTPQMAAQPTSLGTVAKVGLALDGVPIFADAPSVLQTGHMPALDTCGGHIDPGGWYHWHATSTNINMLYEQKKVAAECALPQSARAQFAYAFDGFAIYGSADQDGTVPTDLDACNGHVGPTASRPRGEYHYHATSQFPNLPGCLKGVQAEGNFSTTASQGIGSARNAGPGPGGLGGQPGPGGPGGQQGAGGAGGPPHLAQAAKQLGVKQDLLEQTLRDAGGPQANLAAVAKTLGVSESALRQALPSPGPNGPPDKGR
jgi:hypothetical protein